MKVRIAGTVNDSIVDGPGLRYAVFTQGCPHNCPGCHNPQTHSFDGGKLTTVKKLLDDYKKNPLLKGVTLSGGDPFCQPEAMTELARGVHALGGDVVAYTGWTLEELRDMQRPEIDALLDEVDLLIDGRFIEAQKNLELLFRGSANQRLIDMNRTRKEGKTVLYDAG